MNVTLIREAGRVVVENYLAENANCRSEDAIG